MENHRQLYWGIIGISFVCVLHHLLIWQGIVYEQGSDLSQLLTHWDSAWYNRIISVGYLGKSWAFFPLYPLSVFSLSKIFEGIPPQIIGTVFSLILFFSFTFLLAFLVKHKEKNELLPSNILSWFFLVYSASSFAFHSHHTESLFLLLSFLAFWTAYDGKWFFAAVLAGISWLTRNQGAFVSLCVALQCASYFYKTGEHRKALLRFTSVMSLSFSIFLLYPLYQYVQTGNAFLFIESQKGWSHLTGWESLVRTLWWGNPEQQRLGTTTNVLHLIYYSLIWIPVYFLWKRDRILALYCGLSLAVLFLQASLLNAFRFSAVLFPVHFIMGEKLSGTNVYAKGIVVFILLCLNHYTTMRYGVTRWAY